MTKFQLMLTSLVAVIPGVYLIVVLVMAMLLYSDKMAMMAYVTVGGTLVVMVVTVLMPLGIWMGGSKKAAVPQPAPTEDAGASMEVEAIGEDIEMGEGSELIEGSQFEESIELGASSEIPDIEDEESSDDHSLHIDTSEFDLSSSYEDLGESEIETEPVEEFESFGDEDEAETSEVPEFEEEEEPKPKKKKR